MRHKPRLRKILLIAFLVHVAVEALDRLGFKKFIDLLGESYDSLQGTGILFIVIALGALGLNLVIARHLEHGRRTHSIGVVLLTAASGGAAAVAGFGSAVWVGAAMLIQDASREALYSVTDALANREATSDVRATIHSLIGQATSAGQITGGLALGAVAQWGGLSTALFGSALLLAFGAGILARL